MQQLLKQVQVQKIEKVALRTVLVSNPCRLELHKVIIELGAFCCGECGSWFALCCSVCFLGWRAVQQAARSAVVAIAGNTCCRSYVPLPHRVSLTLHLLLLLKYHQLYRARAPRSCNAVRSLQLASLLLLRRVLLQLHPARQSMPAIRNHAIIPGHCWSCGLLAVLQGQREQGHGAMQIQFPAG